MTPAPRPKATSTLGPRPLLALIGIGAMTGALVLGCGVAPDQGGRRAITEHHNIEFVAQAHNNAQRPGSDGESRHTSAVSPPSPSGHGHADTSFGISPGTPLPDWKPVAGQNLTSMPVLRSHHGGLKVNLQTALANISIAGSPASTTPYNGLFTGPTLRVKPGDTLTVNLANHSGQVTNIHYHGLHVSPRGISDNVLRMMKSGAKHRSVVHIPKDHETGLFWYHAHMHGNTDQQVFGGMRGLLVVGDIVKKHLPSRFRGIKEQLLSINDNFVSKGAVTNAAPTPSDSTLLVNSQLRPTWRMRPGETQLLRFANTGADRFYNLAMPGHRFAVIAEDGSPVWRVYRRKELVLAPGKRFEVLVTAKRKGTFPLRTTAYRQGEGKFNLNPAATLGTVRVAGKRVAPLEIPHRLQGPRTENLANAHITKRRVFRFHLLSNGKNFARINGEYFRMGKINVKPVLGSVEEWTLRNERGATPGDNSEHPFHIHVNDFQVMSVNGKPYRAKGLQDVVTIPVGGDVVIRQHFTDFTGKFVFHCHILGHEDGGMMQSVEVVRPTRFSAHG